jgi:hypothetical protein
MRSLGGSFDAGALKSMFDDGRNTISGNKGPVRGDASNEHVIRVDIGGSPSQVSEHRVAHILWKGQTHLVAPFPDHLQRSSIPVDVVKAQLRYICGAQS